jgi:hypothetical protein
MGRLIISGQEVKFAIQLVEWSKEQGARIFAYDVEDPVVRGVDKLRTILVNAGTVGPKADRHYQEDVWHIQC